MVRTCEGKGGWPILKMRKWQYENEVDWRILMTKDLMGATPSIPLVFKLKWKMPLGLGPQPKCI